MRHEVIALPQTGAEMEIYLADNRAVEPERKRPLALVFPGGAYSRLSDREAEPVALRLLSLGIQAAVVRYSVAPARYPRALEEAAEADRIIVMDQGKIAADAAPAEIFSKEDLGVLNVPFAVKLSAALRKAGFDIPAGTVTEEKLAEFLCR
jgi:hypothetical protein